MRRDPSVARATRRGGGLRRERGAVAPGIPGALIGEQADGRRDRRIARRIREAHFAEERTLADFDWQFNAAVIDRVQIGAAAGASSSAAARTWCGWARAGWGRAT